MKIPIVDNGFSVNDSHRDTNLWKDWNVVRTVHRSKKVVNGSKVIPYINYFNWFFNFWFSHVNGINVLQRIWNKYIYVDLGTNFYTWVNRYSNLRVTQFERHQQDDRCTHYIFYVGSFDSIYISDTYDFLC